jgi:hypothetical protein
MYENSEELFNESIFNKSKDENNNILSEKNIDNNINPFVNSILNDLTIFQKIQVKISNKL